MPSNSYCIDTPKRRSPWLPALVCYALAACGPVTASRDGENTPSAASVMTPAASSFVPGIVIDARRDAVYIMRPQGGIESVRLPDGEVQWVSEHADLPLFVDGDVLYARPGTTAPGLLVASLKTKDGTPVSKSATLRLSLPEGIAAPIDDSLDTKFRQSIETIDSQTYLTWQYVERRVTGIAPADGVGLTRQQRGAFRYADGSFEAVSTSPAPEARDDWPAGLRALFESRPGSGAPWKTADYFVTIQQTSAPDTLLLKRWHRDGGESLPDLRLLDGRALAVLAACDEQFVVVSTHNRDGAPESPYRLAYFSLASGERVAEFPSGRSAAPFCIKGSWLLSVSQPFTRRENGALVDHPLELSVRSLATGTEIWRRAIRDTSYRGEAPPQY